MDRLRESGIELESGPVGIVGLGVSGMALCDVLLKRGAAPFVTEAKGAPRLREGLETLDRMGVEYETGGHTEKLFHCPVVIVSPGVPWGLPILEECRARGIRVLGEIEFAYLLTYARIIAVTGTNGKSTVVSLIGAMLGEDPRVHVAGNIGITLSGEVDGLDESHLVVAEVSSFQLEGITSFRPEIATILNISPDHLDRHRDVGAYAAAKANIFRNMKPNQSLVIPAGDPLLDELSATARCRRCYFGQGSGPPEAEGTFLVGSRAVSNVWGRGEELFDTRDITLTGRHNVDNVLAAATCARLAGAPGEGIREAVRAFRGLEHRMETVAVVDGVTYMNDSKGTNVDAALKALDGFSGPVVWIAGGSEKGLDYSPLREVVRCRVKYAVLVGEAAPSIGRAIEGAVTTLTAATFEGAVRAAAVAAAPGDTVLLSPACASFDMFDNFEHRGRMFKEIVGVLAAESTAVDAPGFESDDDEL